MGHTSKFVNSVPLQLWPNANRWKASNLWKQYQLMEGLHFISWKERNFLDNFDPN